MKKAKIIFDTTQASSETSFVASRGWLRNFMSRHVLSLRRLRRRASVAQKDPEQLKLENLFRTSFTQGGYK